MIRAIFGPVCLKNVREACPTRKNCYPRIDFSV